MFPVFRAHAAPRAVLMFTSGPAHGEAMGTFEGESLYNASLDSAEYRALLDENGFAVVARLRKDLRPPHHLARATQVGRFWPATPPCRVPSV